MNINPKEAQFRMNQLMAEINAMTLDFTITAIAGRLRQSLLVDDAVHMSVKDYLSDLGIKQFGFYIGHRIASDHTLHSGKEGRAIFQEYDAIRLQAVTAMRNAGMKEAEVEVFEILALLTHPNYNKANVLGRVEDVLIHNYVCDNFAYLLVLCQWYRHEADANFLSAVIHKIARYQEYDSDRRGGILRQMRKKLRWRNFFKMMRT